MCIVVVVVVLCAVVLRRVFLLALCCCDVCFCVLGGHFQVRLFVWAFALALALADGPICVEIELWLLYIHIDMCISVFVPSFHRDKAVDRSKQTAWFCSTGSYRDLLLQHPSPPAPSPHGASGMKSNRRLLHRHARMGQHTAQRGRLHTATAADAGS